ncbi:hypothetical protein [Tahibacter soli]|uniref:Uncharacterized protein n=1 Tax=Tahibacter soli TaxID=2983605 RepID=A0A9X4BGK9_9GAMM|nr:hypothetical protein [Tahibacter soli]MDC8012930.1 hypothetical protein [Tahibacter soli]
MQPIEQYKRKVDASDRVVNRMLVPMTTSLSRAALDFAGWLVAGAGAAIGVIVANIDKLEKYVLVSGIKTSAYIYLGALALHGIQRYLSMFTTVVAALDVDKALAESEVEGDGSPSDLSMSYQARVMQRLDSALFWPARWYSRRKLRNPNAQNGNALADKSFRRAQIEAALMTAQVPIVLLALFWLVQAIK